MPRCRPLIHVRASKRGKLKEPQTILHNDIALLNVAPVVINRSGRVDVAGVAATVQAVAGGGE